MPPDASALQSQLGRQLTDLKGVSGGYGHRIAPGLQFTNNRFKERNVRSIIEINPYFHPARLAVSVSLRCAGLAQDFLVLSAELSDLPGQSVPELTAIVDPDVIEK